MIDRCFNPDCRRKLHYLRDGRVVRLITGKGDEELIQHYWLCGPCDEEYDFVFPAEGGIALETKPRAKQSGQFHYAEPVVDTEQMKRPGPPEPAHTQVPQETQMEQSIRSELRKRN